MVSESGMEMTCSFRRRQSITVIGGKADIRYPHSRASATFATYACPVTQWTSNRSPAAFSEIREYFKLRGEIFSLLLL